MYNAARMTPELSRRNDCFVVSGLALACVSLLLGCDPNLVVGTWSCDASGGDASAATAGPVSLPWSTGFENAFCDYRAVGGFCYADPPAAFETVTSPTHSGKYAAAFSVVADGTFNGYQARCVRQGELPTAAYYSAFFFIPAAPTAATNWNLIHFRGGNSAVQHGLWDVSLARHADGSFHVFVFDFLRMMTRDATNGLAVPIGTWFQLEVYWKRATDATGEFAVYQDGELALSLKRLATDDSDFGQWYVGNLGASLTPVESTLYVDDVSIRSAR